MKKVFFLGLCISLFAAQSNADDWYGSISGVVGNNKEKDHDSDNIFSLTSEGGELGVGTYLTPDFRGELSFSYLVGNRKYVMKYKGITGNVKFKHEAYSLLLNGYYDFNNHTLAIPYVVGGIGYADNKYTLKTTDNLIYAGFNGYGKGSKKSFAWQLGAGIDMKAADDIKIGVGYRFRDVNASFKKVNQYHLVVANVKMDF